MELIELLKTKWKYAALGLLCALSIGNTAYAAEDFIWSDVEYIPACGSTGRDGEPQKLGLKLADGRSIETELPTCEEAIKKRVLVVVNGKYLQPVAGSSAEPFIENGRTMVPLRAIADAFGFEVE